MKHQRLTIEQKQNLKFAIDELELYSKASLFVELLDKALPMLHELEIRAARSGEEIPGLYQLQRYIDQELSNLRQSPLIRHN